MTIIIKKWRNQSASLMLDSGEILWTFSNVEAAEQACKHWMKSLQHNRQRHHLSSVDLYDNPKPSLLI